VNILEELHCTSIHRNWQARVLSQKLKQHVGSGHIKFQLNDCRVSFIRLKSFLARNHLLF